MKMCLANQSMTPSWHQILAQGWANNQSEPIRVSPGTLAGTHNRKVFLFSAEIRTMKSVSLDLLVAILPAWGKACLRMEPAQQKADPGDGERALRHCWGPWTEPDLKLVLPLEFA